MSKKFGKRKTILTNQFKQLSEKLKTTTSKRLLFTKSRKKPISSQESRGNFKGRFRKTIYASEDFDRTLKDLSGKIKNRGIIRLDNRLKRSIRSPKTRILFSRHKPQFFRCKIKLLCKINQFSSSGLKLSFKTYA